MSRRAILYAPVVLHHIIWRGLESENIEVTPIRQSCKSFVSGAVRDEYPLLRLGIAFKPSAPSAADRQCALSNQHAKVSYWIRGTFSPKVSG